MRTPERRKQESMAFLAAKGVSVVHHLPLLESEDDTCLRAPSEVARRAVCLVFVADFAQGHADGGYWQYVKTNRMESWFTPWEWRFLNTQRPDKQTRINMSWRIEGAYLLLWSLGCIDELPFPTGPVEPAHAYRCLPEFSISPEPFIDDSGLIPKSEILDKADLIYRMHWATRQAPLTGQPMPAGLDGGVVQEWHHAINWLTCYGDLDWDDVSTDT